MKEVGAFEAKTHLSALLDEVARGETTIITRHGRPAARLTAPEAPDGETLRDLRKRIGWATTEAILQMRDEDRR